MFEFLCSLIPNQGELLVLAVLFLAAVIIDFQDNAMFRLDSISRSLRRLADAAEDEVNLRGNDAPTSRLKPRPPIARQID